MMALGFTQILRQRVIPRSWKQFITAPSSVISSTLCRNVTTSRCLRSDTHQHKYEQSYVHNTGDHPLIGKTIGEYLDETTEKYPDREAVIFCRDGRRCTFAELRQKVDDFAAGLLSLGINQGDRVGIWAPNVLEWVITQYATARIGAILVNINPAYRTDELEYALRKVSCKAIVLAETFKTQNYYNMLADICPELETAAPGRLTAERLPELRSVVMIGNGNHPGTFNSDNVSGMGNAEHKQTVEELKKKLQFDDAINIQFTSGTTGNPKGATLSHHNIVNNCFQIGNVLGYSESYHRISVPVPMYHCFGMVLGSLSTAVHGSTVIFPSPSFEPEPTLKAVNDERVTSQYGTPTMFIDMLHHPNFDQYDLSSLSTGVMAGSPCPVETMKQVNDKMHMKEVTICYGLTEVSPVIFQSPSRTDTLERRVTTVGWPSAHTEVKVINPETGHIVDVDTPGELCSRGYTTMLGYWDDEKKTREAIDNNQWFHTGDLATIDESGYGRIVGRIKDMIIRGGENIYPTEIEQFLYKHPKVEDIQVIGIPDERLGEEVCAWIKLKSGQQATPEEIKQFCKGQIAHFKIPKVIQFVEGFPLTVTGKVQKYKMRQEMMTNLKATN
ncbi:medium-chain acyl-CoA ligase ACSF2, mitochondrial-like [Amphiura filiformis]|uniref:medium-chain acyl-CoA ligase ACSF2, mitochondrial-like n=1 Tax=Amphiura filiformis TaxID=82378 RepID=UPI003B225405